ncbi:MAG: hypothetical protein LBD54_03520, partial [Puniceicoccales bacterium]|nr:hypothetical protein [Puniceicoccales bacterium]
MKNLLVSFRLGECVATGFLDFYRWRMEAGPSMSKDNMSGICEIVVGVCWSQTQVDFPCLGQEN